MSKARLTIAAVMLTLVLMPAAFAQQGSDSEMKGMQDQKMGGTNMQAKMKQCAQMRQQMKPDAPVSEAMKRRMAQCDQMDKQTGGTSSQSSAPRTQKP